MTLRLAPAHPTLAGAEPLPLLDGGTRFESPWQARLFGITVAFLEARGLPWDAFRDHLVRAVAAHADDPAESAATAYYSAWLIAFEALLQETGGAPGPGSARRVVS